MTAHTVGLDLGGTSLKAIFFDDELVPIRRATRPTPRDDPRGTKTADALVELLLDVTQGSPASIGLAVPGIVDEPAGVVRYSENLAWTDVRVRDLVAERVRGDVALGHDVRLGGLAEFERGAAAGEPDAIFVPIGTGISLAARVDARTIEAKGWAGEIGMFRVGGVTLEDLSSAGGLARRLGVSDGEAVLALVAAGDAVAVGAWNDAISALGEALSWSSLVLGARVLVVGGGLALAGEVLLAPLTAAMDAHLGRARTPAVKPAAFGTWAACHGAAMLARRPR